MEINKVSIIGLGALGILFGHHLSKKMPKAELRIIADRERINKYEKDHVYCNGECCNFTYLTPIVGISGCQALTYFVTKL